MQIGFKIIFTTKIILEHNLFTALWRFARSRAKLTVYFKIAAVYVTNMSVKHTLVLLWVIFLSYKVVTTGCQVIWVNHNVTDSFRVGKDGCMNNQSLCTSSARCHSDGLCLCKTETPNYRNPVHHKKSHVSLHNDTYGCISNLTIRTSISGESNFHYIQFNCAFSFYYT